MAKCCDALFLLTMTEVAMTTVISSHVKDENCFFAETNVGISSVSIY